MEKLNNSSYLYIKSEDFLDWYFFGGTDDENQDVHASLAESIRDCLFKTNQASISVQELFDNVNHNIIPFALTYKEVDGQMVRNEAENGILLEDLEKDVEELKLIL